MCLDNITKVYKPSLYNLWIPKFAYKSGVGWKEFSKLDGGDLQSMFKGSGEIIPVGEFLDEEFYRNNEVLELQTHWSNDKRVNYNFGWHICLEKPENFSSSSISSIKRVKYKFGHTLGIDKTYDVSTIVAKYMKILEE